MIDAALTTTNHTSLYYVGHSQGTLIMFAKLASEVKFSKKVRKFFALAPICTAKYIKGMFEFAAHNLYTALEVKLLKHFKSIHDAFVDHVQDFWRK